ncbi:MAG: hypothetical protein LBS77_00560, partial [Desulfovibrio sp.]|nr:hypothetical protein [Desulfovibrio sp.]
SEGGHGEDQLDSLSRGGGSGQRHAAAEGSLGDCQAGRAGGGAAKKDSAFVLDTGAFTTGVPKYDFDHIRLIPKCEKEGSCPRRIPHKNDD